MELSLLEEDDKEEEKDEDELLACKYMKVHVWILGVALEAVTFQQILLKRL